MFTKMNKTSLATQSIILMTFLIFPAIASAAIVDRAEIFKGHVTITRSGEYDLLVTIDQKPTDGIADEAFVYRSATALPTDLHDFDSIATLVLRPNALLVRPKADRELVLAVTPAEGGRLAPYFIGKRDRALFIDTGYQLSRFYGADPAERAASLLADSFPTKEEEGCWAGGEGSTGCSLEGGAGPVEAGCSVECGNGYHSCCTPDGGCQCEPN